MEMESQEICTSYTLFPQTQLNGQHCTLLSSSSAFISAFQALLYYTKLVEGQTEFPRQAELLFSAKEKPKFLAQFSSSSAESRQV